MSRTFTVVNDEVLTNFIRQARKKIVYVAPGVSKKVAEALGQRFPDLGKLSITLIVDLDAEVYRLGYGDLEGLALIKELADEHVLELRQQPGVRIGLLIADDTTLVYAPTPRLIEAGSKQETKPNAILLGEARPDRTATQGIQRGPYRTGVHVLDSVRGIQGGRLQALQKSGPYPGGFAGAGGRIGVAGSLAQCVSHVRRWKRVVYCEYTCEG